jgi:hypothetical protein
VNREYVKISDSVLSVSGEHRSELDEEEVSFYVRNATTELSEGA